MRESIACPNQACLPAEPPLTDAVSSSLSSSRPSRIRLEFGLFRRRLAAIRRPTCLLPVRLVGFPLRRSLFLLWSDHDRVLLSAGSSHSPLRVRASGGRFNLFLDDSRRGDGLLLLLDERSQVVDLAGARCRRQSGRLAEESFESVVGGGRGGSDGHSLEIFDLFFQEERSIRVS